MGQLDDAIEASRRQAEAQRIQLARQEEAAAAAAAEVARRAAEEARPLVDEFIERASSLGITPEHKLIRSVRTRQVHRKSNYLGNNLTTHSMGKRVLDGTVIRCWQLAPGWEGYQGGYYLSEDGFHMVQRHEQTPLKKVWYSADPRSDLISTWHTEAPTLQDVVFYKPAEREGPSRVDTLLKQAMVYFFQTHQAR